MAASVTARERASFWSAFVGWIFDYYDVTLLALLEVPISRTFGLSTGQIGETISVQLGALAVGGVVFGLLADKVGRRPVLLATVVIYCAANLARAFSPDYVWLLAWTAVAGLGLGGEYGVGQTLVSEMSRPHRRGLLSGFLYGGSFVGSMIASLIVSYAVPEIGWRAAFGVSAAPVVIAIYIRMRTPESEAWAAKSRSAARLQWGQILAPSFIKPFFMCLFAAILQFFAYYGITSLLPTYLVKTAHFSISGASWWYFFTAVAGLVGCAVGAYTMDRWGRRVTLSYLTATAAVAGIVLYALGRQLSASVLILILFFFLYFGSNGGTVFGALFSEMFPTELRSTGVSSALQIARGLAFIPPLVTAALLPRFGYGLVILIGACEFLVLAAWAWVFKETKGVRIAEIDEKLADDDAGRTPQAISALSPGSPGASGQETGNREELS